MRRLPHHRAAPPAPPSPYGASQAQPGKNLLEVENVRLRAQLKKAAAEVSTLRAEYVHVQGMLDTHQGNDDEPARQPTDQRNFRVPPTPNDDKIDGRKIPLRAQKRLAVERILNRDDKIDTPVADGQYRSRAYARHEQAMSWTHGQRATGSGHGEAAVFSLNVSINKALSSKGHWFHMPDVESLERFDGWVGRTPVSVIEVHEPPPRIATREVAVPVVKERIVEVPTVQRVTSEVAVPVEREVIKEVCAMQRHATRGAEEVNVPRDERWRRG